MTMKPRLLLHALCYFLSIVAVPAAGYTRLMPLPAPSITSASEDYPGGNHKAQHLIDGDPRTEYSSNSKGTATFVEFDLGRSVGLAGFRHLDRNDPATVAASELLLLDENGREKGRVAVSHANQRAGLTFEALASPIQVRRVRWQVTQLGPRGYGTVGGAEIAFYEAGPVEALPTNLSIEARAVPLGEKVEGGLRQPLRVQIDYAYAEPIEVRVQVADQSSQVMPLVAGRHTVEFHIAASDAERRFPVRVVTTGGQVLDDHEITVPPLRQLTVYVLPHSHTDIGYTEIQTDIEEKQVNNLLAGIAAARRTAHYPEGARFVWNVEVLWAADLFLRRMDEDQCAAFLDAVERGDVALCGMYLNELTGLCRPEELVRLFRFATVLRERTGAPLDSVMISDVPGLTWGTVNAMTSAGLRYLSTAPNYFDRIGDILVEWENKPFWWVGPDGTSRVLVWIPFWGYAMSHRYGKLSLSLVEEFQSGLEKRNYPYDIAYVRWAGHGDNAVPDAAICDFIKDWSARYAWPRFIISSASEAFRAFETRYGEQLPQVSGDWTPYWEDGAGSSALETALNRASSDRVAQAEALWALLAPDRYPATDFEEAWSHVLLYSEHTWGAWCSVSEPHRKETLEQWAIKRSYAATADTQSRALLSRATALVPGGAASQGIDLYNTTSWTRSELVIVPRDFCEGRDRVSDDEGGPVASQRLRNGDLVILARDVPPFAARRYSIERGAPHVLGEVRVSENVLENDAVKVVLDPVTGAVAELRVPDLAVNLVDAASGHGANDYLYLIGDNPAALRRNGPVTIQVKEPGPLVASLLVIAEAPGCHRLEREVQLVAGLDHVTLINLVDKRRLEASSYHASEGKESVNFAFPFNVPGGQIRIEVPFGVVRPDLDQIPSACKNWFTAGRWADVANDDYGVTWITLDAPLVQVGGVTATLLNSQTNPDAWLKRVGATQQLYSWAMNNHWGTNYRAYQEGPVLFRYGLRPHRGYDPAASSRFAIAQSQPLIPVRARGAKPDSRPRLRVWGEDVLVSGFKPSDDGRALILRLWGATDRATTARLEWSEPRPVKVWLSDTSEKPGREATTEIDVPPWGLVTLRAERISEAGALSHNSFHP
jgi:alpha-mannosidase